MDTITFCLFQNNNFTKTSITSMVETLISSGFRMAERKLVKPGFDRIPFEGSSLEFVNASYSKVSYKRRLELLGISGQEYDEYWFYLFYPTSSKIKDELVVTCIGTSSYNETVSNCYPILGYEDEAAQLHLQIATIFYDLLGPSYGWVNNLPNFNSSHGKPVLNQKLKEIYWANFFGPEYVAKYGREFLLNAPGWKKEELHDGGVLLQLSPRITETDQGPELQELANYFAPVGVRNLGWPKSAKVSSTRKLTLL